MHETDSGLHLRLAPILAALVLIGLGAAGWAVWSSTSSAHREARNDGRRMAVDVVAPTEPDLIPGPPLSVGALRDGYDHDPERLTPPGPRDEVDVETAWLEPEQAPDPASEPAPDWTAPLDAVESLTPLRQAPPYLAEEDYTYGFDALGSPESQGPGGRRGPD